MAFMRAGLAASYPQYPDFNPLMVAENESQATPWIAVGRDFYQPKKYNFRDMTDGTARSDCPPPCSQNHISASFLGTTTRDKDFAEIVLTFSDIVLITTTSFPQFNLDKALAELGGAMGLWLGVGVLQILEILSKRSIGKLGRRLGFSK